MKLVTTLDFCIRSKVAAQMTIATTKATMFVIHRQSVCIHLVGCPEGKNTCSTDNPDLNDMIENYLDDSYDECMNIFTIGQTERIDDIFWTYRESLTTSNGLTNNDFIVFGDHNGDYNYNNTTRIVSQSANPYSDFIIEYGNSVTLRSREQIVLNSGFRASF